MRSLFRPRIFLESRGILALISAASGSASGRARTKREAGMALC
jgi:hypothetical protein